MDLEKYRGRHWLVMNFQSGTFPLGERNRATPKEELDTVIHSGTEYEASGMVFSRIRRYLRGATSTLGCGVHVLRGNFQSVTSIQLAPIWLRRQIRLRNIHLLRCCRFRLPKVASSVLRKLHLSIFAHKESG